MDVWRTGSRIPRNKDTNRALSVGEVDALRRPLRESAVGKCDSCGSTLMVDPLPHVCGPRWS